MKIFEVIENNITINNPTDDGYNDILVNDKKVGYIVLSPTRKEYDWIDTGLPNSLALVEIKIDSEFRNQGLMKQAMKWLEQFAKSRGYESLFLRVGDDSEISQDALYKIYTNFGFRSFEADDDDEEYMYKILR